MAWQEIDQDGLELGRASDHLAVGGRARQRHGPASKRSRTGFSPQRCQRDGSMARKSSAAPGSQAQR
jgi:hypothetical protein